MKLFGRCLMARNLYRQVAEVQVRIAGLYDYTALGIFITDSRGKIRLAKKGAQSVS
tara:strand:- start:244 stop:411 length:168 start_codon:yes stop_codon:yes gene_type:complete